LALATLHLTAQSKQEWLPQSSTTTGDLRMFRVRGSLKNEKFAAVTFRQVGVLLKLSKTLVISRAKAEKTLELK
jgi:hypothetical protein